jgi:hypothetical protein
MNAKRRKIIEEGCKFKEVNHLDSMVKQRRNPLLIKAREIELYLSAIYEIKRKKRKKEVA